MRKLLALAFVLFTTLAYADGVNRAVRIAPGPGVTGDRFVGPGAVGTVLAGNGPGTDPSMQVFTTFCPAFTSVLKGCVPASGGGTANLLRADATWTNLLSAGFTASTIRADANSTPITGTPGSTGVELGNSGTYSFIQTAVRPTFSYGSQNLNITSGGAIVLQTSGLNTHATFDVNGQLNLAVDSLGPYTGLTLTHPSPSGNTLAVNCAYVNVFCINNFSVGFTTPDNTAFPVVTLVTNAVSTASTTLNFASVPGTVIVGMGVTDVSNQSAIGQNVYVASKTATTVVLTSAVTVASGDTIQFNYIWSVNAFNIQHQYGGSAMKGGRQSFYVYSILNGASNWGNANNQYVAAVFNAQALTSDGGTDLGTNAKGGVFSLNTIAALNSGATNMTELGIEFSVSARAGSSVKYKNGISVVALTDDAVRGSSYDAAISISSQNSSSIGWLNGILFSAANNGHAVAATGCLICTQDTWTVTKGIDFSTYTITGAFLNGPGSKFTVDGPTGNIGTRGSLSFIGSTSGSASIVSQAIQGSPTIVIPTTGGTFATSASSPLVLNATTGALTCPTCLASTPSALTKTDDTNITLTLGGTPATALLQATSITVGWTGTLAASRGGTGLSALGTGVATALAVNVGTAGAFVVNGGVLGSPSSAGTIPAFTLGGTIAGGGNQINNVIIGTTTPLAGSFTTITGAGAFAVTQSINSQLLASISNTNAGSSAQVAYNFTTDAGFVSFFVGSTASAISPVIYSNISGQFRIASLGTGGYLSLLVGTGGVEQVRLLASGGLTVGTFATDPAVGGLFLSGQQFMPNMALDTATADSTVCTATTGGKFLKGTGALGVCLGTSGRQFKHEFKPMVAGLAEIVNLKLWNYRYKSGHGDNGKRVQYGPTAQDVAQVMPDLVRYDEAGNAINYDWGSLLFASLHAIQELKANNDNQQAEIEQLKRRIP